MSLDQKLNQYIEGAEQWKVDHDEVMDKYDSANELAEFLYEGLDVFRRLRDRKATTFNGALRIADAYFHWLSVGNKVLPLVDFLENEGFQVNGSTKFREYLKEVTILAPELSRVVDTATKAKAGEGVPLSEFIRKI